MTELTHYRHGEAGVSGGVPSPGRDLVEAGRRVAEFAVDSGSSERKICSWRRHDRIDRGLEAGLSSAEQAELHPARTPIRELETALAEFGGRPNCSRRRRTLNRFAAVQ